MENLSGISLTFDEDTVLTVRPRQNCGFVINSETFEMSYEERPIFQGAVELNILIEDPEKKFVSLMSVPHQVFPCDDGVISVYLNLYKVETPTELHTFVYLADDPRYELHCVVDEEFDDNDKILDTDEILPFICCAKVSKKMIDPSEKEQYDCPVLPANFCLSDPNCPRIPI